MAKQKVIEQALPNDREIAEEEWVQRLHSEHGKLDLDTEKALRVGFQAAWDQAFGRGYKLGFESAQYAMQIAVGLHRRGSDP